MDALTRAQIIWAETKDLRVPDAGDPATLSALRRHVAAIANEAEKTFTRFEAIPARDDESFAADVADCAAAAETPTPDALKNRRVILWPSADGKTLNKDELKPPAPWDTAAPETMTLIGRYEVDDHDVSAFSRPVVAGEDEPRFASLVTGTGLPRDTDVYVPRGAPRRSVDPRATKFAYRLAFATLLLFAFACVWAVSVGSLTRSAQNIFVASVTNAAACPTAIDPANPATLYGAPRAWLPTATGPGDCLKTWQEATLKALNASNRDWWSKLKGWLAKLTVADAGQAFSLRMPTLLMMVSLVLLAAAAGLGVVGRGFGLFIDKRNRMSLTRIQFALWLVILIGGLASFSLYNVGFWAEDLKSHPRRPRLHAGGRQDGSEIDRLVGQAVQAGGLRPENGSRAVGADRDFRRNNDCLQLHNDAGCTGHSRRDATGDAGPPVARRFQQGSEGREALRSGLRGNRGGRGRRRIRRACRPSR